jgi:hypothetical protein
MRILLVGSHREAALRHLVYSVERSFGLSMSRTGLAHVSLHGGKAPRYFVERMVPLSREIVIYVATEFGREEVLRC